MVFKTLRRGFFFFICLFHLCAHAQLLWQGVDSLYGKLPPSVHVYFTNQQVDTGAFRAFYLVADLKDKHLQFTTDTTVNRRLTPQQFYTKNDMPLAVVNCTFFSFETNRNLNVVIKDGKVVAQNAKTFKLPTDTTKLAKVYSGAIGIAKNRKADVAWIKTDSTSANAWATQFPYTSTGSFFSKNKSTGQTNTLPTYDPFNKWKMKTAVGGGPVLIQNGEIKITNNEERMFAGKAINDKHPRTAMGYTADNKLIILVIEGRNPNAGGATLTQTAQILKDLHCVEALNLDGGGSSCLLVNGKETIVPAGAGVQRPVPAVFVISEK